jgi:hypothetical protein
MKQKNIEIKMKKKEYEIFKKQQEFFEPYSPGKKNVKLLQIIFELKSKSEELKLFERLIFDKNIQLSEFSHKQLLFFNKKMVKFYSELTKGIKYVEFAKRKNQIAYLELVTGIKSKKIIQYGEIYKEFDGRKEGIKKWYDKYGGIDKVPDKKLREFTSHTIKITNKKFAEHMTYGNLINEVLRNKISIFDGSREPKKLTIKQKKDLADMRKKVSRVTAKGSKTSEKAIKKIKEIEEQIQKVSELTDSCEHCYQKVSKTYQKDKLRKLERKKKELTGTVETLRSLNVNLHRTEFQLNREKYLPFKEAKRYVNMLMLKSEKEWHHEVVANRIPVNIPRYPHIEYRKKGNEWSGYADWLGVKPVKFRSFKEARELVQKMNLKNGKDWRKAINSGMLPADIPKYPDTVYKKQWKGEKDFFNLAKDLKKSSNIKNL